MYENIRTRFAPSPTGRLHIGNARTAILNWLFARHSGGRLILRIEDTDRQRSTKESEEAIIEDLKWLGIDWDEGPDCGGDFGPYRQSERLDIYSRYAEKLREMGRAYPCYCKPEELEERRRERLKRKETIIYDGRCRELTESAKKKLEAEGRRPVLRFKVEEKEVSFEDRIKGKISFLSENIGDFVIMRQNGMPMYNFSCVVDDHLMRVSHVIRGDDHVSNTPRQVLLYRALGWDPPVFAHVPMILGKDGARLSKRWGAVSVAQYRNLGYLPDALFNFLSLLSWSSESGDEIISKDRLIKEFDFDRISASASIFDQQKLDWMNGIYIRRLSIEEFTDMVYSVLKSSYDSISKKEEVEPIARMLHNKVERLSQISEIAKIFFQKNPIPENDEAFSILKSSDSQRVLEAFLRAVEDMDKIDRERFQKVMNQIKKDTEISGKSLWMPVRVALTGSMHGPDLPQIAEFLGLKKCREFISRATGQKRVQDG